MLEAPWNCTILGFLLANCYGINKCNVFIGQYNQNDRNSFERCAISGPQKHITKESDGFHNHFTQLTMICERKFYARTYARKNYATVEINPKRSSVFSFLQVSSRYSQSGFTAVFSGRNNVSVLHSPRFCSFVISLFWFSLVATCNFMFALLLF